MEMMRGKKTILRAIEREDLPIFIRWFNDPEVRQYLLKYMPMSPAEGERRWFERQLEDRNNRGFAIETTDGVHIGDCGLHDFDWESRSAVLGIAMSDREYREEGYGSDAVRTLLGFAFGEMNLHRVQLEVYDFDLRALRCYEKCGFKVEGRRREALFRNGCYHDILIMSILLEEFEAQ
jgi:RimJ/RimL family protein N-acetyltransferase